MDFDRYRKEARDIEVDFISNGRSYEDVLDKIVVDLFNDMESDYNSSKSKIKVFMKYSEMEILGGQINKRIKTGVFVVSDLTDLNQTGITLIDVKVL